MSERFPNADLAYMRLSDYTYDLLMRMKQQDQWRLRHPDWKSEQYALDETRHQSGEDYTPASTFDPDDPMPSTSDVLTAQVFLDLLHVAIIAYDRTARAKTWEGQ